MKNNMSSISLEIFHGKRLELPKSYVKYKEKHIYVYEFSSI